MARVRIRVHFPRGYLGPGKIDLLEKVVELGSISAAGREMGMSYRRAWQLIDAMNQIFSDPVVTTQAGGKSGGGASVTSFGHELIADYRELEARFEEAAAEKLLKLDARAKAKI